MIKDYLEHLQGFQFVLSEKIMKITVLFCLTVPVQFIQQHQLHNPYKNICKLTKKHQICWKRNRNGLKISEYSASDRTTQYSSI